MTDTGARREAKKVFISYRRPKTQKHLVSIDLFCSGFSFYEYFSRQFTEAVFYIQNPKINRVIFGNKMTHTSELVSPLKCR